MMVHSAAAPLALALSLATLALGPAAAASRPAGKAEATAAAAGVTVFSEERVSARAYDELFVGLGAHAEEEEDNADLRGALCAAHGRDALARLVARLEAQPGAACGGGVIALGAAPLPSEDAALRRQRLLVIAAELDGVSRLSAFAAARHRARGSNAVHAATFVVLGGASHASFHAAAARRYPLDLSAEIEGEEAASTVAAIVRQWARRVDTAAPELDAAEARAAQLADPIVEALELEGSSALGKPACNSDFPTNPTCNYPKYPDFSLPPGPAPAPDPPLPSDCVCGSRWVTEHAFPAVSGADYLEFDVTAADTFHDVADTHPFHLPHTWNECDAPAGCTLNVTTLSQLWLKPGDLWNATDPPLSALEIRGKMKSRQTLWQAAGLGKQSEDVDKKNLTMCKAANQLSWEWALAHADADVRARFEESGERFVMVDDKPAPIGITGPEWIKKEMVYTRVADDDDDGAGASHIEIQSWMFVVGPGPIHTKYLPTGMHYCKLLSPARAMEWIYTDGLRAQLGA